MSNTNRLQSTISFSASITAIIAVSRHIDAVVMDELKPQIESNSTVKWSPAPTIVRPSTCNPSFGYRRILNGAMLCTAVKTLGPNCTFHRQCTHNTRRSTC